ncbi:unnamed protein product [Camellia sinensis]
MLIGYGKNTSWLISVKHLSNANVLVNSDILFSISLLDCGSPYLGHHFQVQVICRLQGHSLGGLGAKGFFLLFPFCVTCNSSQGLYM